MGKYLKMSGVFDFPVKPRHVNDENGYGFKLMLFHSVEAECAAHAINSHDELVENMQNYKQEAEQWEVRATKEASRVQDLVVEVERLRGKLQDAYLDGCHAGWDMSGEGYNAEYGGPEDGAMHDMFVTKSIECMK